MEIEAETPATPAPPLPPPPPPDPAPPPVPAAGVTYPAPVPPESQSPAPVGAPAFYQDPYSSFSQYGAVQQYADPQVRNSEMMQSNVPQTLQTLCPQGWIRLCLKSTLLVLHQTRLSKYAVFTVDEGKGRPNPSHDTNRG